MSKIRLAIVGVGNCASALVQGIDYYKKLYQNSEFDIPGIMYWSIGPYKPFDIEVSCAFDIDKRKVGKTVGEAIFAQPNCTTVFQPEVHQDAKVYMGRILDGFSEHMRDYDSDKTFVLADEEEPSKEDIVRILKETKTDVLVNYVPVGSEEAARFYAECCLAAGVGFVNCMPVFIVSNPAWDVLFQEANIPAIGDDIKSQLGATIVHRVLTQTFADRGVKLERTYQLNTGGNTDFLNMLNRSRLASKKESKTEAVQACTKERLQDDNIHVGPSDYVPWQKDNKICYIRMEGKLFGEVPMTLDLKLSVEDSPNSAGVVIDAIRFVKLAKDRKVFGSLKIPSSYYMKHPPVQIPDSIAKEKLDTFLMQLDGTFNDLD